MKALFDTNVVLDVLLDRHPFSAPTTQLFSEVERGRVQGYLCATTITTVYYLSVKVLGRRLATEAVGKLLQVFEVAPVNRRVLEIALAGEFLDLEDAVIDSSAIAVGVDALVTRDEKGFASAQTPVFLPHEFLAVLYSTE